MVHPTLWYDLHCKPSKSHLLKKVLYWCWQSLLDSCVFYYYYFFLNKWGANTQLSLELSGQWFVGSGEGSGGWAVWLCWTMERQVSVQSGPPATPAPNPPQGLRGVTLKRLGVTWRCWLAGVLLSSTAAARSTLRVALESSWPLSVFVTANELKQLTMRAEQEKKNLQKARRDSLFLHCHINADNNQAYLL